MHIEYLVFQLVSTSQLQLSSDLTLALPDLAAICQSSLMLRCNYTHCAES